MKNCRAITVLNKVHCCYLKERLQQCMEEIVGDCQAAFRMNISLLG